MLAGLAKHSRCPVSDPMCQILRGSLMAGQIQANRLSISQILASRNGGTARPQVTADALSACAIVPYRPMVPPASCPSACHSDHNFVVDPQNQYQPFVGTWYVLREKVRFFEPFRYGATWSEVHKV
jgi:hypothetical protein